MMTHNFTRHYEIAIKGIHELTQLTETCLIFLHPSLITPFYEITKKEGEKLIKSMRAYHNS